MVLLKSVIFSSLYCNNHDSVEAKNLNLNHIRRYCSSLKGWNHFLEKSKIKYYLIFDELQKEKQMLLFSFFSFFHDSWLWLCNFKMLRYHIHDSWSLRFVISCLVIEELISVGLWFRVISEMEMCSYQEVLESERWWCGAPYEKKEKQWEIW